MKQVLLSLALYRQWAYKVLLKKLNTVSPEILNKDMETSFGTINKTLFHLLKADYIWWQRIQLKETFDKPAEELQTNIGGLSKEILSMSANWVDLIRESSDMKLEHVFEYRNTKREAFKQPLYEALIQVFNHQTYHQGQIISMLRQQKVDKIPPTDFIVFTRTKGKIN
ncbi:MAG: hypothetical protein J0H55_01725 [Chitinophagaceae bacterium]|nr:hypothetical protein [Chitinophagaceae bacterium]